MSEAVDIDPIISKLLEGGCLIITILSFPLLHFRNGFSSFFVVVVVMLKFGQSVCERKEKNPRERGIVCAIHAIAIIVFEMLKQWKENEMWSKKKIRTRKKKKKSEAPACACDWISCVYVLQNRICISYLFHSGISNL